KNVTGRATSGSAPAQGGRCVALPGGALRELATFRARQLFELALAHGLHHLSGGALEARFGPFAPLRRKRGASGHLLLFRSRRHGRSPRSLNVLLPLTFHAGVIQSERRGWRYAFGLFVSALTPHAALRGRIRLQALACDRFI